MTSIETWRLLWAKTDRSGARPEWTRPLWAHLIDVANTALLLWEGYVPAHLKRTLAEATNLNEHETGQWFALQIGLHDLGKAIPSFQHYHKPSLTLLKAQGLKFPGEKEFNKHNTMHHGHATIAILMRWYESKAQPVFGEQAIVEGLAAFIGFHHGKLLHCDKWRKQVEEKIGGQEWRAEQYALLEAVIQAWSAAITPPVLRYKVRRWPAWLLGVAGWCTLADWLGSMEDCFPEVSHGDNIEAYISASRIGAEKALATAGLTYKAAIKAYPFSQIFSKPDAPPLKPRLLQEAVINLPLNNESGPTLTIVEAPTGEGKTEAAFYLAARQQEMGHGNGIYIAMPSQATSNGLFGRFESFLESAHDVAAGPINLVLIHGSSALHPDQERLVKQFFKTRAGLSELYNDEEEKQDSMRSRIETAEWFLPKKRSLLAPYGIGTVDQALLGILFSKHFFLRLFGLAGKTVIFDEVHAYDAYMTELFCRLLEWLRRLGTNVVLLSATLPDLTRQKFTAAWNGLKIPESPIGLPLHPYPAIWHVPGEPETQPSLITFAASQSQAAKFDWGTPDPSSVIEQIITATNKGATVAVIVNTVARAQKMFQALTESGKIPSKVDITLFHARFPYNLRKDIEQKVLSRFGPKRPSKSPGILIATQVAEQSLDLDFDYMLSDLAPVDLLLQRAGRLHRHSHHRRPAGYEEPTLVILVPEASKDNLPDMGQISGRGHVYEHSILNRTWQVLRHRSGWVLPGDYRELIESVYGPESHRYPTDLHKEAIRQWKDDEKTSKQHHNIEKKEAETRLINTPENLHQMVSLDHLILAEEDEENIHEKYQALTRLGGPSVDVVCLHRDSSGKIWLNPDHTHPLPSTLPLHRSDIRAITERVVRLSGRRILNFITSLSDAKWDKIAENTPGISRLRPLIFLDGEWTSEADLNIKFNTQLGIIY